MHAWAGAVLSLLLAILGLSGALLVFEDDYLRASFPPARIEVPADPATLGQIAERAEATFGAGAILSIRFADTGFGLTEVRLKSGGGAYLDGAGELVVPWAGNGRPEVWLFDLHHHLLVGETGEIVTGIAGLAAVLLTITGLIALWPARRMQGLRIWPRTPQRRELLASHRNLGLMAAVPLLWFAISGAGMVFSEQTRAVLSVLNGPQTSAATTAPATLAAGPGDLDWTTALTQAQAQFPQARIRFAVWPRGSRSEASVRLRQPGEWHPNGRSSVSFDPASQRLLAVSDARTAPRSDQVYNGFYPLHAARIGTGLAARLYDMLTALTGLALFALGALGCYAFLVKRVGAFRRLRTASAREWRTR
ncbi:PepSY-associated TM helix domain-containing protein [uncultured Maricaulis sp.]|uniref:PepSY-associated TM helix domain-containing protein n=1 Tax=uncultured Maricaulis sp. TaxID=174710 RepID=UPI0030D97E77